MATITSTLVGGAGYPSEGLNKVFKIRNQMAFATVLPTSGDTIQLLSIPAGALVTAVYSRIITAGTTSSTATVGDGAGAASWIASILLDATAGTVITGNGKFTLSEGTPNTIAYTHAYAAAGGKYYAAADTIDIVVTGTVIIGVLELTAEMTFVN